MKEIVKQTMIGFFINLRDANEINEKQREADTQGIMKKLEELSQEVKDMKWKHL